MTHWYVTAGCQLTLPGPPSPLPQTAALLLQHAPRISAYKAHIYSSKYLHICVRSQEDLLYRVCHAAGLNPRAFRCRYTKAQPGVEGGLSRTRPLLAEDNGLLQVCGGAEQRVWGKVGGKQRTLRVCMCRGAGPS